MEIAAYLKTSLIEWPGKISSVIFVPGCNFRCPFCHNADLVLREGFTLIPEERIFADLVSRKGWIEAVIVTGGEPTMQGDLLEFLKKLKKLKLLTMIHTNGTNPEVIEKIVKEKLCDYIAMDIKGDFKEYERYIGRTRGTRRIRGIRGVIEETARLIVASGVEYEFRTTVVPGLHNRENLLKLGKEIREIGGEKGKEGKVKWFLQQFRPMNCYDKTYLKIVPYSKEDLEKILSEIKKIIPLAYLRGL